MTASFPVAPGGTLGVLGGGQLGRMLACAAARLGLKTHIYCPDEDRPAGQVAARETVAPYNDETALARFADVVDVVTFEFENVPAAAARFLDARVPVRPAPTALEVTQDRSAEKTFLRDAGIATTPFVTVDESTDLAVAVAALGGRTVLKTRRWGYDGKGQALALTPAEAAAAWAAIDHQPAIAEAFVDFSCEVSVIVARAADGTTACYDGVRNVHEGHILARSIVPAGLPPDTETAARAIAETIARRLDYVGVLAVEMFVVSGPEPGLLVNEIAPRVHNSGHWTLDACAVSQFEQHVRAVCGWPLGSPLRYANAVMENLLGSAVADWAALAAQPNTAVHIYGKHAVKSGRKMGHATRLFPLDTRVDGQI